MKYFHNTWLADFIYDGIKYVKVKEECANDNEAVLLLLCAYCILEQDNKLEALLTGEEVDE